MTDDSELGDLLAAWKRLSDGRDTPEKQAARDGLLMELFHRHEEAADAGLAVAVEDLCRECPELTAPLRALVEKRREVSKLIDPNQQLGRPTAMPRIPGHELIEEWGRGGMGVVYKARHVELERLVAVKMILTRDAPTPDALARFQGEYRAVGRLNHANIVVIYDVGEVDKHPFFSMEFCAGGDLAELLHERVMPPRAAARLVGLLAKAIHHAHERDILHRDLKPSNILFDGSANDTARAAGASRHGSHGSADLERLTPKISDFGLARRLDDGRPEADAAIGTACYMSPEQARGDSRRIGEATDVWGLGAIFYECLTGRPPFRADSRRETLDLVIAAKLKPVGELRPKTPRDLAAICENCLKENPVERYQSAAELAADLDRFLKFQTVKARRPPIPERVAKWYRRNWGLATAAVLLFAIGIVWTWQAGRARVQREILRHSQVIQGASRNEPKWWTEAHLRGLFPHLLELEVLDRTEASSARRNLNDVFSRAITLRLSVANLRKGAIDDLRALIRAYGDVDAGVTKSLAAALDSRLHRWDELFRVSAGNVPEEVFDPRRIASRGGVLVQGAATGPAVLSAKTRHGDLGPMTVLSRKPCEGNVRLSATFDRDWERAGRLSLHLNARQGHTNWVNSVTVSPDGRLLATASGQPNQSGEVIVWNRENGVQLVRYQGDTPLGVRLVAFSPTQNLLAVATMEDDSSVDLLDTSDWKRVARLGQKGEARCLAFSRDGNTLAVGIGRWDGPSEIKLWEVATKRERKAIRGHVRPVQCLAFSHDEGTLASGGWDARVRLWDLASGEEKACLTGHREKVLAIDYSPDRKTLATAGPDGVRLWDAKTGKERSFRPDVAGAFSLAFSPDGTTLGVSHGSLVLLDTETWKPRHLAGEGAVCSILGFAPGEDTLYTGGYDGVVREWDGRSGTQRQSLDDRSYTFVVSSVPHPPPAAGAAPPRSFLDARPAGEFGLQILRNGILLRRSDPIKASEVPAGPIRLAATREGDQLTFELDGHTRIVFQDSFPLPGAEPGAFGVELPPEVGLLELKADHQVLPEEDHPFERGDYLYARGLFERAREQYRRHTKARNDLEVYEARYKEALCLRGLLKTLHEEGERQALSKQSEGLLKEVIGAIGDPWRRLARCELWLHYLEANNTPEADKILPGLADTSEPDPLVRYLPASVRDQMVANLRQKTWGINLFQVEGDVRTRLERLDRVMQELHATELERVTLKIALLRAYWQSDKLDDARRVARELIRIPDLHPVNRIMVVEEYGWILRQALRPEEALRQLDECLVGDAGEYREPFLVLLLERARIQLAAGRPDRAEHDIRTLLERVPEGRLPYRYRSGAYLILGFLHAERGGPGVGLDDWRLGFRPTGRANFLESDRVTSDFGSLPVLHGLILGSLTGDLSDVEAEAIVTQLIDNGMSVSALTGVAKKLMPNLTPSRAIPPEVFRAMWTSDRARENARRVAFQDLPLSDYLKVILATGSAALLRHEITGDLSEEQEEILWELAGATASAFFAGQVDRPLLSSLGIAWKLGNTPAWENAVDRLKGKGLDRTLCDPLRYFFGHRLCRRNMIPEAKRVFSAVARKPGVDPRLKELAERELASRR